MTHFYEITRKREEATRYPTEEAILAFLHWLDESGEHKKDPEVGHGEADIAILALVPPDVRAAYNALSPMWYA